jgi:hypothetical protein
MVFHPKVVAIFPKLKDGSFSITRIRKNTFSSFQQDVSLKCPQFFIIHFAK